MQAISYLLPQPTFNHTPEMLAAFEDLFRSTPVGDYVDYRLPYPKWQYLSYLCEAKELVLHGSQIPDIDEVEPRQALDVKAFSNQRAIYATTDGIWVIYFAIIDRKKFTKLSLFNSCLRIRFSESQLSDPFYFFSLTQSVLVQAPWCEGTIYILPRQSFEREAPQQVQAIEIVFPHWISQTSGKPLAKLSVGAQDFPFLAQIHGHNDEKLNQMALDNPTGFPWPEALES